MILKILLNSLLFGYLALPVQSDNAGLIPTLNDDNQVSYQISQHYLPQIDNKYDIPRKVGESLGIKTTADSVIIIDDASGQILFQKNPGRIHAIASLVKLMTAYVFLEQDYDFGQVVEISLTERLDPEESTLRVSKGEQITVYDIFQSALVGSANNATREMVLSLGYSEAEFTQLMNDKAKALGMNDTQFVDVTGIGKGNTSTVADYVKLARLAFDKNEIMEATTKTNHRFVSVSGNERFVKNSNNLLASDLNIVAGKTGFTYEAGYCLALKVVSDDREIIILSLGSDNANARFSEVKSLAGWTYQNYQWD